jgi:hypothetical protein
MPNPYCVTDRYYDNLRLASYPRVQTRRVVVVQRGEGGGRRKAGRGRPATKKELVIGAETLQRVRLELHGRLLGHYTAGGLCRRIVGEGRYRRGRIANGVVLLCRQDPRPGASAQDRSRHRAAPWPFRRYPQRKVVVATFSARRRMPPFPELIEAIYRDHLKGFELYSARSGKEFLAKLLRWRRNG